LKLLRLFAVVSLSLMMLALIVSPAMPARAQGDEDVLGGFSLDGSPEWQAMTESLRVQDDATGGGER